LQISKYLTVDIGYVLSYRNYHDILTSLLIDGNISEGE